MEIEACNITKNYLRKTKNTNILPAVKETSIELSSGKMVVVMGRSGGGKSTLISMLSGLLVPSSGKVRYDDIDIYSLSEKELGEFRNKKIGYIPQGTSAIFSLNVKENILLPITLFGHSFDKIKKDRYEKLLDELSISHLENVMPVELSGGELRRMAVARALVNFPEVIFADEPTGDLDEENTKIVFELLSKEKTRGAIVVVVTHEEIAKEYADELYKVSGGELSKNME